MVSSQDIKSHMWGDNNFTYSLDADNAFFYLGNTGVDYPVNGNVNLAVNAMNAWR